MQYDVCVIGGGPAGAALATRLAQLGHSVVLLEKQLFPRSHVGESLVGDVVPLLSVLGVKTEIENAGFLRPTSVLIRWDSTAQRTESFAGAGFQVDRGRFDQILLQGAVRAGAVVLQPARILELEQQAHDGWRVLAQCANESLTIAARFIADATGRQGRLGGLKRTASARTLALYAYWRQDSLIGPETRVEAGNDEWFWGAPLANGEFNATVFIDSSRYASGVAHAGSVESFYRSLLSGSVLLADCLEKRLATPVRVCDASSIQDENPATEDSIKVGEASFSIDPLSSQGVQTALGSALHAAAVLHTMMVKPANMTLALEFYRTRQSESVVRHADATAQFYLEAARSRIGGFWTKRAAIRDSTTRVLEGTSGIAVGTPVVMKSVEDGASRVEPLPPETRIRLSLDAAIEIRPVLRDDLIVPAQVLITSRAVRPIAFLGNVEIAALLHLVRSSATAGELMAALSKQFSAEYANKLCEWLWNAGVLQAG
jgi:flavin-dependent dehydrogenase